MSDAWPASMLVMLLAAAALRLWLSLRQERHVRRHRDAVPPAFAARISLAAHQQAADYSIARTRFTRIALAVELLLLLGLTYGGGLDTLHEHWSAHTDGIAYGMGLIASIALLASLVDLPLDAYRQFRLEARFGFSRMTFALYLSDCLKQALLAAALGLPLIAAALWLMQATGAYWWLYVGLLWIGFNLVVMFIYPLWIAPLFNHFTPLPEGEPKRRIRSLLERCGFDAGEIFVMDGSRRSSHGNAYFTGLGKARRIVLFDTLLERLAPAQIEAVLAHEIGHFQHRHIAQRMAWILGASLLLLALLGQLLEAPGFYHSFGVTHVNTAIGLSLFALVLPMLAFPCAPLFSALARRQEFEADAYAARMTSASALATALVQLYADNASTLTPDPLHSLFHDSHPPASQRIARLQTLACQPHAQAQGMTPEAQDERHLPPFSEPRRIA